MEEFVSTYNHQVILTIVTLVGLLIIQFIMKHTAKKVGRQSEIRESRIRLMFKYINILMLLVAASMLALTWGINFKEVSLLFTSVFAVIGVALFANWSILSNITAGIILFFSFPYKIGDTIEILDKDMPVKGVIEDIKAFHIHLRTEDGKFVTYPNNLLLQKAISFLEKVPLSDEGKDAL